MEIRRNCFSKTRPWMSRGPFEDHRGTKTTRSNVASRLGQTDSRLRLTECVNLYETQQDTDVFLSLFHVLSSLRSRFMNILLVCLIGFMYLHLRLENDSRLVRNYASNSSRVIVAINSALRQFVILFACLISRQTFFFCFVLFFKLA